MAAMSHRDLVDSEQQSTGDVTDVSGKDTPDPEKEIVSANLDGDVEKQSQDHLPSQETASPVEEEKDPSLVEFDGPDDPDNPKNWTARRRIGITACLALMTFVVTFSSTIFAVAVESVAEEFHIGTVTATLGVALFLLVSSLEASSTIHRLISAGFRTGSGGIRSSQRGLREKTAVVFWLCRFCDLSDPCCCCAECRNYHARSVPEWFGRKCSFSGCRWISCGHVESG